MVLVCHVNFFATKSNLSSHKTIKINQFFLSFSFLILSGFLCESSFTEGETSNGVPHKGTNGDVNADPKIAPSTVCPFCFMDLKSPEILRA